MNSLTEGRRIKRIFKKRKVKNHSGHPASQKQRDIVRARNLTNNPMSNPESRKKVAEKNTGRKPSEETKNKMREAQKRRIAKGDTKNLFKKGHKISEETKNKMRITHLRKPNPYWKGKTFSQEYKIKLREAQKRRIAKGDTKNLFKKGHKISEEERHRRISRALTNNPMSNPESRKRLGQSITKTWLKRIEPKEKDILKDYSEGLGFCETMLKYSIGQMSLKRLLDKNSIRTRDSREQWEIKKQKMEREKIV